MLFSSLRCANHVQFVMRTIMTAHHIATAFLIYRRWRLTRMRKTSLFSLRYFQTLIYFHRKAFVSSRETSDFARSAFRVVCTLKIASLKGKLRILICSYIRSNNFAGMACFVLVFSARPLPNLIRAYSRNTGES